MLCHPGERCPLLCSEAQDSLLQQQCPRQGSPMMSPGRRGSTHRAGDHSWKRAGARSCSGQRLCSAGRRFAALRQKKASWFTEWFISLPESVLGRGVCVPTQPLESSPSPFCSSLHLTSCCKWMLTCQNPLSALLGFSRAFRRSGRNHPEHWLLTGPTGLRCVGHMQK